MPGIFCYDGVVRSFLKILIVAFLLGAMLPTPATNGMTDEEKKQLFLKAREEMQTVEPTPTPSTGSTPKPKPASHRKPTPRKRHHRLNHSKASRRRQDRPHAQPGL